MVFLAGEDPSLPEWRRWVLHVIWDWCFERGTHERFLLVVLDSLLEDPGEEELVVQYTEQRLKSFPHNFNTGTGSLTQLIYDRADSIFNERYSAQLL
jgi:hypothetical protein